MLSILRVHLAPVRMGIIKIQMATNPGEDVGIKPLFTVVQATVNQYRGSSKNRNRIAVATVPLLGTNLKDSKSTQH